MVMQWGYFEEDLPLDPAPGIALKSGRSHGSSCRKRKAFQEIQLHGCDQVFADRVLIHIYHHISSYIIIYHHISSYIIIYHHISSYIIIYHHISSYIIIYHHISSYIIIYHHISSYIIIYHHISSYIIIYHHISSYIIIYHHISSYIIIYHHISTYIIIYHHISSYIIIYHHISSYIIIYQTRHLKISQGFQPTLSAVFSILQHLIAICRTGRTIAISVIRVRTHSVHARAAVDPNASSTFSRGC